MDVHIPRSITLGLRMREVDAVTAQEDGSATLSDPELLDRAHALRLVLFTFDDDLLAEATRRQCAKDEFAGVVYAHPLRVSIGAVIRDLELVAKTLDLEEMRGKVVFLPL